jgi:hypothetical protein
VLRAPAASAGVHVGCTVTARGRLLHAQVNPLFGGSGGGSPPPPRRHFNYSSAGSGGFGWLMCPPHVLAARRILGGLAGGPGSCAFSKLHSNKHLTVVNQRRLILEVAPVAGPGPCSLAFDQSIHLIFHPTSNRFGRKEMAMAEHLSGHREGVQEDRDLHCFNNLLLTPSSTL